MSAPRPGALPSIFSLEPGTARHVRRGRFCVRSDMGRKGTRPMPAAPTVPSAAQFGAQPRPRLLGRAPWSRRRCTTAKSTSTPNSCAASSRPSSRTSRNCRCRQCGRRERSTRSTASATISAFDCQRVESWADHLLNELRWLPTLAPALSLAVPEPVARGEPGSGYPFTWAIYRWIEGNPFAQKLVADERRAAADLAQFVTELRQIDPSDAPRTGRPPLAHSTS